MFCAANGLTPTRTGKIGRTVFLVDVSPYIHLHATMLKTFQRTLVNFLTAMNEPRNYDRDKSFMGDRLSFSIRAHVGIV